MIQRRLPGTWVLALSALLLLAALGCSAGGLLARAPRPTPTPTKTLRPTFTPTPMGESAGVIPAATLPAETSLPVAAAVSPRGLAPVRLTPTAVPTPAPPTPTPVPTPTPIPPTPTPYPTPWLTVLEDRVNVRQGPDLSFEKIGQVQRGERYAIQGRVPDSSWWQICCVEGRVAWVAARFVQPQGILAFVPVLPKPATPTVTPTPTQTPTPSPTPTPIPPFDVARGPEFPFPTENPLLTIWVWVYEGRPGSERSLPGYRLKVLRNGVDVSTDVTSHGDPPRVTSKAEGSYKYNLKYELKDPGQADWVIYLTDATGRKLSPERKFTTRGSARKNLFVYIAYIRLR
ncbi:MAG: SH3 domain-containing protein [Chloroflexi bacterium]|nr:SH3 domain-containing protein [Chloroflexota bacterium]